jgi:hypothetical protein
MKPRLNSRLGRRRILEAGIATGAAVLAPKLIASAIAQEDPRVKRAKAKGKVTWYTSMFPTEMREKLADKFQRNTGIELSIYGAGTNQVVARLRTERTAGSRNVDVIDGGDFDVFEDMIKDGFLKKYNPKDADAIHPDFKDSRGYYYGILQLDPGTRVQQQRTDKSNRAERLARPSGSPLQVEDRDVGPGQRHGCARVLQGNGHVEGLGLDRAVCSQ